MSAGLAGANAGHRWGCFRHPHPGPERQALLIGSARPTSAEARRDWMPDQPLEDEAWCCLKEGDRAIDEHGHTPVLLARTLVLLARVHRKLGREAGTNRLLPS